MTNIRRHHIPKATVFMTVEYPRNRYGPANGQWNYSIRPNA